MKKLQSIKSFSEGEKIQGFYLCVEKHIRHTRSGDIYLDLELRDITGNITAKIWDNVSALNKKFKAGNAVAVSGNVELFLDQFQLVIKKINKATIQHYSRYGFDPANVVPSSKKDSGKMWNSLGLLTSKINNYYLRKLVEIIYRTNKKKLLVHPATVKMNHSYRSGLLEHILSMAQLAKKVSPLYNVNQDLVLAGVLLHGIGKLREINSEYISDYTLEGNLIGEVIIGRDIVRDAIKKIRKFPKDLAQKIEHIILSNKGQYGLKSPQTPSFSEALLVHHIQLLDAKMNIMDTFLEEDKNTGDFTSRHNYFNVPLFKDNEIK